jgi:xylan 1,4-beta-xylosidase
MQMGISAQLQAVERGFKILAASPKWRDTPVILGEFDPDGCAACTPQRDPRFGYRNVPLYGTYTADAIAHALELAQRDHVKLQGIVTWAFEFEDQPYFVGFRELATNGLDKPVFNAFRMFGLLGGNRVEVTDPAALATEQVLNEGVRGTADIRAIATRTEHGIQVMLWNYHDDDVPASPAAIELTIDGLPVGQHALLEHFRIDSTHSNAFAAWKAMGSPPSPTADQYKQLDSAGQLQVLTSPRWIDVKHGSVRLHFELPRQGVSLVRIGW